MKCRLINALCVLVVYSKSIQFTKQIAAERSQNANTIFINAKYAKECLNIMRQWSNSGDGGTVYLI